MVQNESRPVPVMADCQFGYLTKWKISLNGIQKRTVLVMGASTGNGRPISSNGKFRVWVLTHTLFATWRSPYWLVKVKNHCFLMGFSFGQAQTRLGTARGNSIVTDEGRQPTTPTILYCCTGNKLYSSHVTGPRFVSDLRHDAWKDTTTTR